MLKERKYLGMLLFSISFLLLFGCREETQEKWWSQIQFVDSTYTQEKSEYFIGDTVYILFTGEHPHTSVSEGLPIELWDNLGDDEVVSVCLPDFDIGTLINPRAGKIKTKEDTNYEKNNGTLEVSLSGDTIFAFSMCKSFPGRDTAYVKPRKEGIK